mmetsp:Transcript_9239/g.28636  ORF Transcript_9239/g.28636 Transcript_9239/m.28636 type:complete len:279 (+) Transcript_9239:533-1369(+)
MNPVGAIRRSTCRVQLCTWRRSSSLRSALDVVGATTALTSEGMMNLSEAVTTLSTLKKEPAPASEPFSTAGLSLLVGLWPPAVLPDCEAAYSRRATPLAAGACTPPPSLRRNMMPACRATRTRTSVRSCAMSLGTHAAMWRTTAPFSTPRASSFVVSAAMQSSRDTSLGRFASRSSIVARMPVATDVSAAWMRDGRCGSSSTCFGCSPERSSTSASPRCCRTARTASTTFRDGAPKAKKDCARWWTSRSAMPCSARRHVKKRRTRSTRSAICAGESKY